MDVACFQRTKAPREYPVRAPTRGIGFSQTSILGRQAIPLVLCTRFSSDEWYGIEAGSTRPGDIARIRGPSFHVAASYRWHTSAGIDERPPSFLAREVFVPYYQSEDRWFRERPARLRPSRLDKRFLIGAHQEE